MKISPKLILAIASIGFATFLLSPCKAVWADEQADVAAHKRKVDADIQSIEEKIAEMREDYKEDGVRIEQKIREYEDQIAEIKRDSARDLERKDAALSVEERQNMDKRVIGVRQSFTEWRLRRAVNNYGDRIDDLKMKAAHEVDEAKKTELNERIQKLDAKYNAAKAKLNDLRTTDGENWDRIENELSASLKEIDRDFDEAQQNIK